MFRGFCCLSTNCTQCYIEEVEGEKLLILDQNLVSVTTGLDWKIPDRAGGVFPDPDSFVPLNCNEGALNCDEGDYQKMGTLLDKVNWGWLRDCCIDSGDNDGSVFMELVRLTCLQLALLTCPRKRGSDGSRGSKSVGGTRASVPASVWTTKFRYYYCLIGILLACAYMGRSNKNKK